VDIRDLGTRGSSKLENDRSPGPNGPRCPLPLAVQKWKARDDAQLLDFLWEHEPALLMTEPLELHTDDWTLDHVKSRAALDKTDRRDTAQAMFALDKTNRVVPDGDVMRGHRVAAAADAIQAALTTAAAALRRPPASPNHDHRRRLWILTKASQAFEVAHRAKAKRRRRFMKALHRKQVRMQDWVENHRDDTNFLNLFNEQCITENRRHQITWDALSGRTAARKGNKAKLIVRGDMKLESMVQSNITLQSRHERRLKEHWKLKSLSTTTKPEKSTLALKNSTLYRNRHS
jgi:hypothetical protein